MKRRLVCGVKVLASYLAAGAAYLLYFAWPNYAGHAHVPFSAFPEFLVWAPVAPYLAFGELFEKRTGAVVGLLVFGAVFVGGVCVALRAPRDAASSGDRS